MAQPPRKPQPVVLDLGRLGQHHDGPDTAAAEQDWLGDEARPRPPKRLMSLRIDADVVEFFRAMGPGWQSRMNAVLRAWMEHRKGG